MYLYINCCCISVIVSAGPRGSGYVPYRDSVLTWLLKDTLSGGATTVMIASEFMDNFYCDKIALSQIDIVVLDDKVKLERKMKCSPVCGCGYVGVIAVVESFPWGFNSVMARDIHKC